MDDRFIEDLKNRIDIVEVVRKYAEIKKAGKNYMCRSPFRNERAPSFCVSQDKQMWYDFGTSEGGDVISFLQKIENMSFSEAVETLADIAGIEIPKKTNLPPGPSKEEKKDIATLHEMACQFFESQKEKSEEVKKYLEKRSISPQTQKEWRIGYGGEDSQGLTKFLLEKNFSQDQIALSGVAFEREFGLKNMKDRFFKRLIIPIFDSKSPKIIAFSGRDLSGKDDIPKYVNSPENPLYHKSSTLFALDKARKTIREKDRVILVEGYFDVISAHKIGFEETVATCGTSLTEEHLRILKRLTQNIYLAFDSDKAGKLATLRAVELCLEKEVTPFIVDITGGKDFDEVAQKAPETLKSSIQKAENAIFFLLDRFAEKYKDGSIEGEKKFLDSIFSILVSVSRPIEKDEAIKRIAEKIKRSKGIVEEEFRNFSLKNKKEKKEPVAEGGVKKFSRQEAFVGFVTSNWKILFAEKENVKKIIPLLDGTPQEFLEKFLSDALFDETEKITLSSWQMSQELLYAEASEQVIKRDFQGFLKFFEAEEKKRNRLKEAWHVRESLKKGEGDSSPSLEV